MANSSLQDLANKAKQSPGSDGPHTKGPSAPQGPVRTYDLDMRIARDGTWFYHGSPIGRKRLVRLFSTVLRRDDDGAYYLVTPVEKARLQVDDAPFIAVEVEASGEGKAQSLRFRTNVDDYVTADAAHPIRVAFDPDSAEPSPYVEVRDGLEALIARSVYYHLVALGVEERRGRDHLYGVWSEGEFFPLGTVEAEI